MTFAGRPQTSSQSAADIDRKEIPKKKPHIPLSPAVLPSTEDTSTLKYLSILDTPLESAPFFIKHDEVIAGVRMPKYLPRDSEFITMVEWPLRPGDTR
jgi:hypothetical protein